MDCSHEPILSGARAVRAAARLTLLILLWIGFHPTAGAQVADSARLGAPSAQQTVASRGLPATRVDTAIVTIVRPSHIGKYITIGAVLGAASSVAFAAYDLKQCDTNSNYGPSECLGAAVVAPFVVVGGTLVGVLAGWGAGLIANARR